MLQTCTPEVCTSPLCEEDSQVLRCPRFESADIPVSFDDVCFFSIWKIFRYCFNICNIIIYQNPSKGCQMVPKGCRFTIPYRVFVGTPFKVLVCSIYIYFNLTSLQRFEKRVTPGAKCSHMECYYSWKSCFAKSSSFSVASPLFVKKQAPASSKWPFDTWNGGYDSPLIKSDQRHFENHLA